MNRAIVLIGCLSAAGAVAAYTHYSHDPADQPPVFTVHAPQRSPDPTPPAAQPRPERPIVAPRDRVTLTRALQRELKRVGCYSGDINGVWTTSSRMAMQSFTDRVNASLPIDKPDQILLSLVQGYQGMACDAPCASDRVASEGGRCIARADSDDPATEEAKLDPKTEPPNQEQRTTTTGAVVPATAAAAAVAASAAASKGAPKAGLPGDRARPAAAPPDASRSADPERATRHSGPVPSERVYKRSSRRSNRPPRPPKIVRNILRAFGIR